MGPVNAADSELRLFVYRFFAANGRAPSRVEIGESLGLEGAERDELVDRAAAERTLVLQPSGEIWMAMPFSAVATDYRVTAGDRSWWADCAWDALGIGALLGRHVTVHTHCPIEGSELQLAVSTQGPEASSDARVHFAVPAARWWDDIGYT